MSSFARTPGNSRHDALRDIINSPRQRVQRIIQVTRTWWFTPQRQQRPEPTLVGPGGRRLSRRINHGCGAA
jgi:hypothetical protein